MEVERQTHQLIVVPEPSNRWGGEAPGNPRNGSY